MSDGPVSAGGDLARDGFVVVPGNPVPDGAELFWYEDAKGRPLRACICAAPDTASPRGTVILCPGRTEFIEKYFEVMRELQARGFAVLVLDWPGQGLSYRFLNDHHIGHIDHFTTFSDALARAMEVFGPRLPQPHVALAHSMGSAICMKAMLNGQLSVKGAAFSAPMWAILTPPIAGVRYIAKLARAVGLGKIVVQRVPPDTFEGNIVTHCRDRWAMHDALVRARPGIGLGPVTWGWVAAALDELHALSKDDRIASVDIPVFVAAAEEEKLIDNSRQKAICDRLPDCEYVMVPGAMHEVLMETDERRALFWHGFDRLLVRAGV